MNFPVGGCAGGVPGRRLIIEKSRARIRFFRPGSGSGLASSGVASVRKQFNGPVDLVPACCPAKRDRNGPRDLRLGPANRAQDSRHFVWWVAGSAGGEDEIAAPSLGVASGNGKLKANGIGEGVSLVRKGEDSAIKGRLQATKEPVKMGCVGVLGI